MLITINSIKFKNLFSVGNTTIELHLDQYPITALVGKNGNGKSIFIDAINLALFNKPFRNITKAQCINSINNGKTEIELVLTKGTNKYRIVRGLKPNKFEIYENDIPLEQLGGANDFQDFLETSILGGMNERVFKQVVLMGATNYTPFMQLPLPQRREIIEELLDIKIFSQMLDLAKKKLITLKDDLVSIDREVELIQEKIKIQETNQKQLKEDNTSKKLELDNKIIQEQAKIADLTLKLQNKQEIKKSTLAQIIDQDNLLKSITKLQGYLSDFKAKIKISEDTVKFFENNQNCPTCKQSVHEGHKNQMVSTAESKALELNSAMVKLNDELMVKQKTNQEFIEIQKQVQSIDREIYNYQTDITTAQRWIENLQKQVDNIDKNVLVSISEDKLQEYTVALAIAKDKHIKVYEEKKYYDATISLLKDDGIKTKIIKQYIPVMNKVINEYLQKLGLPVHFSLDEQFNEVIKSRYRDGFQYNNFSEGEKQKIDISLMLSWRQIAKQKNTINCNLLVLDEVLNSNLDVTATDELINILAVMDKDTNIFMVSHRTDLSEKVDNILEFQKIGNFTQVM